jgi:hypothetical protein
VLELKDVIALSLGSAGFVLSLINLGRSVASDRRMRQLTFASEKQSSLVLMREEELALESQLIKVEGIIRRARSVEAHAVQTSATEFRQNVQQQLDVLKQLRRGFDRFPSSSARHEDLVSMREGAIVKLRQFQAERSQKDGPFDFFCTAADEQIELFRRAHAQGIDPNAVSK